MYPAVSRLSAVPWSLVVLQLCVRRPLSSPIPADWNTMGVKNCPSTPLAAMMGKAAI